MIQFLRDRTTGVVAKGLLVLIAGAVVVTGSDSLLHNRVPLDVVAVVGEKTITTDSVNEIYRNQLARLQQLISAGIPTDVLRQRLVNTILDQKVEQAIVSQYTEDLGLIITDKVIVNEIAAMPEFQTAGIFDKSKYNELLSRAGLSEARFAASIREGLPVDYLSQALEGISELPPSGLKLLRAHDAEERQISYTTLALTPPAVDSISDDDATTYYNANRTRFLAPERRTVSYVVFGNTPNAAGITDADVSAAYDARKAELTTEATRTVEQWLFSDKEQADAAKKALENGSWATLSKTTYKSNWSDLGKRTPDDLPETLAAALFENGVTAGSVVGAIESQLGHHVFYVKTATAEKIPSLAEAAPALRERLAVEAGYQKLVQQSEQFEKAIEDGQSFAQAATAAEIPLQRWTEIARDGTLPDGSTDALLAQNPGLSTAIFNAVTDENSGLQELAGGNDYLYFTVKNITPAAPRPFAEVADAVKKAVAADRARQAGLDKAQQVIESAKSKPLIDAASAAGFNAPKSLTLLRAKVEDTKELAPGLRQQLLSLSKNTCASDDAGGVVTVACLTDVRYPAAVDGTPQEGMSADLRSDILDQLTASLKMRTPVVRNDAAIARLMGQE
ncbi:MAG: SurA N-terminal domain-containing protein [Holosporales bacterium]